jgi:hypothetical protein
MRMYRTLLLIGALTAATSLPAQTRQQIPGSLHGMFHPGSLRKVVWCPEGDLNPHDPFGSADFKSAVSADFTIRACYAPSMVDGESPFLHCENAGRPVRPYRSVS